MKLFINSVMCRFGFHKWEYSKDNVVKYNGFHKWEYIKDNVVKCNRTCKCCGKKMHSSYDMTYGETIWLNGHYW